MTSYAKPSISNEIHDLDVITAQNFSAPETFNTSRHQHKKTLREHLPPHLARKVVAEMIARFLLVFVTCGAGALSNNDPHRVSQLGASVAGGLIVTVMIYAVGHISGAHMNPAVTLAFAVSRHFPWIQVPFYTSAQISGAMVASFVLKEILHPITNLGTTKHYIVTNQSSVSQKKKKKNLGTTTPSDTAVKALVMEIVVTFSMMFVTSAVATDTKAVGELAGLAVGSAVCITSILAGPVSGGSMNPARTLGPAVASNRFDSLWVYFVGPVCGTLSGAWSYSFIRVTEKHQQSLQQGGSSTQKLSSFKLRRLQSREMASPTADAIDHL